MTPAGLGKNFSCVSAPRHVLAVLTILAGVLLPPWGQVDVVSLREPLPLLTAPRPVPSRIDTVPGTSRRTEGILRVLGRFRSGMNSGEQRDLAETIIRESRHYGFDPELILAVITAESSFNVVSRSDKGALGLMQLLPKTALELLGHGSAEKVETMLLDPTTNVRLGIRYLAQLVRRYGDVETALVAYNRGPGAVSPREDDPSETIHDPYATKILREYDSLLAMNLFPHPVASR